MGCFSCLYIKTALMCGALNALSNDHAFAQQGSGMVIGFEIFFSDGR
jgi:hypothetical protein